MDITVVDLMGPFSQVVAPAISGLEATHSVIGFWLQVEVVSADIAMGFQYLVDLEAT